jgi:hypothetical protein
MRPWMKDCFARRVVSAFSRGRRAPAPHDGLDDGVPIFVLRGRPAAQALELGRVIGVRWMTWSST